LAIEKNIHFFMVGTCLDKNPTPGNSYAAAKSELKNLLALEIANRQITWFRPFYIFNLDPGRPRILQELLANKNGELVIHSPNTLNDYVYLEDVSTGMTTAIENDLRGQIDIGSGFLTSNRDFIDVMSRHLKFNVPIYEDNVVTRGDSANIEQLLSIGWSPSKTLELFRSGRKFQ
jgi:nucleoside-diphosphate-sugar epimerase